MHLARIQLNAELQVTSSVLVVNNRHGGIWNSGEASRE